MKQFVINIWHAALLFLLAFVWSCVDEELVKSDQYDIVEGMPVHVSLKFGVEKSEIVTRTAADSGRENTVIDLFVIAFNSNGELSSYRIENGNETFGGIYYGSGSGATGVSQGTISNFTMYSGQGQTIYAVANVNSIYTNLSSDDLLGFTGNETEFLELTCSLTAASSTQVDRGIFVMSGQLDNVAISENSTILQPTDATIPLTRLEARITFKIKVDKTDHDNLRFTPSHYRVHRIPQGSYLFPKAQGNGENDSWDYTTAGYQDMTSTKNFDEPDDTSLDGFFEFYVWENRLTPKKRITTTDQGDTENLYALREKRERGTAVADPSRPGQEYVAGAFEYANANSTYVEIVGNLSYENEEEGSVSADVTYYVHLGSTGNDATAEWYNNEDLVNNYNTERNKHYIYNVTLKGVESLRVEVEEDKEQRPGMEGDVTATQRTLTFDAHYGRTSFTLNRGDFMRSEAEGGGLSWSINTPFQNRTKSLNVENYKINGAFATETQLADKVELKTDLKLNDYRWIQFVINSEAIKTNRQKVASNEFAKYPGYEAYLNTDLNESAPAFGSSGYHYEGATAYYGEDVPMYDINQLLNHLYVEANDKAKVNGNENCIFDSDGNVTITAFIDEYIYIYNPNEVYYRRPIATTRENLTLWKNVVNSRNRTLSISYGIGRQYSPDGNTSWQTATITFSQMPIRTFYNPTVVPTAWGTESIVEGKEGVSSALPTYPAPSRLVDWRGEYSSMDNGRENTVKIVPTSGNLRWSHVLQMETSSWGELDSNYRSIWYACLGRNRDLNGDDIVQEDEIRWYLASIDQLTDLWIGEAALPDVAKLYDDSDVTTLNVPKRHVASSSVFDNSNVANDSRYGRGNVWMIWAEEGASRGDVNRSYGANETGLNYDYRCVRNLGISLADIEDTPEDYVDLSKGDYRINGRTYSEYRIDVSKLNNNTLRAASPNQLLGSHTERDDMNRPARQFAVIEDEDNAIVIGNYWNSITNEDRTPICPPGYRLPNQRELLLLTMYFGPDRINRNYEDLFTYGNGGARRFYVARTEFGFNDYTGYTDRPGFSFERVYDNGDTYAFNLLNGLTASSGGIYYARCVRDVE